MLDERRFGFEHVADKTATRQSELSITRKGAALSESPGDSAYQRDLAKNPANHVPLTPLSFLARSAAVYPDKIAVIHGRQRYTYRHFAERCHRLASALARAGVGKGDTVSVLAPNIPALLEAHYGVPMLGAVLNAINIRLDADTVAFILEHGGAKVLIADREFAEVAQAAVRKLGRDIVLVEIDDPEAGGAGHSFGGIDYEAFLEQGDPGFAGALPDDEWQAIALNYTSGTTGNPKGVVYAHRGAYLNAIGQILAFGLTPKTRYLWTLPMFHCNGWTYTWAVTAIAGTHVCLRRVDPALIFPAIRDHTVTHMCGAPIVLNMMIHAPEEQKLRFDHTVEVATGGAAPPSSVIERMEAMGFRVTHLYGLTETYGPSTVCDWQEGWAELELEQRSGKMARQGVHYPTLQGMRVVDPETMLDVSADGETLGEVLFRGNTVMMGYLKNPAASDEAFAGGWYHSGDLAVLHPDGYMEVKDRAKDIIISGGENISSLEVEEALYRHPSIMEAAVVARPDEKWGESPCAFVTLKPGAPIIDAETVIDWCRQKLARYKIPRTIVFGPLPKTSTGKIQKFVLRQQAQHIRNNPEK
ncbi:MAG: acyl-CoA synthetase [Alphaproteobacteria bacterium]|nr:acyl-CoA synthetase [Alphaproteobacteria bacterium]MBU0797075.1 acyl-CoA synthetase [Alphaproteobacteria bacterium]MBU0887882.1 acyl-CoA synthetase [Alphaproteobacteria bacterium]MBU1814895.1 acyl-CoA synthetase [Alphaproteobacteria bacterium]